MVQKKLPLINSAHGSDTRNIINELIKLFNSMGYTYDEALKKAHNVLSEAKKTNDMNVDVQNQLDNLVIESGNANAEVSQARDGFPLLKDRLDESDAHLAQIAINPKKYGAKGDGVSDDTQSIKDACDVIQANGGGTLYFPNGIYNIKPDIDGGPLYIFEDLDHISITGSNAVINDVNAYDRDVLENSSFVQFMKCKNIKIDNGVVFKSQTYDMDINTAYSGIDWLEFIDECSGINIDTHIYGGHSGIRFNNELDGVSLRYNKSKNINVNLKAEYIRYPYASRWSGDHAKVNLDIKECGRPFFIFGVENVELNVESKNTITALIKSYSGHGCENIKVYIKNTNSDTTRNRGNGELLSIHYGDQTPAVMRNIDITLDIENYENGWGHSLSIDKFLNGGSVPDTKGRGHVLEDLKVSGYSKGRNGVNHLTISRGEFKAPDVVKHSKLEHFKMSNGGSINLNLRDSLQDEFKVIDSENTDGNIAILNTTGIVNFINSKALNFLPGLNDSRHHYENSATVYENYNALENKTMVNTMIKDKVLNRTQLKYVADEYDRIITNKIFGSTVNEGTKETVLINNEDIHYDLLQRGNQFPRIYKLLIGTNASSTRALIDSKIAIIPDGTGGITDVKLIGTPEVTNILGDNVTSGSLTVENDSGRIKVILSSDNQMAFGYIQLIIKEEF